MLRMAEMDIFGPHAAQVEKGHCQHFKAAQRRSVDSIGEPVVQTPQDQVRAGGGKEITHSFAGICGAEQATVMLKVSQEKTMTIFSQVLSFGK